MTELLDELLSTIEDIQSFRLRYLQALKRFLTADRIHLTLEAARRDDRPHTRATLRCIEAAAYLQLKDPPALRQTSVRSVVATAWKNPKATAFGVLNLYTSSNILYLARYSAAAQMSHIRKRVVTLLARELRKSRPNPYLVLFAQDALSPRVQSTTVSRIGIEALRRQIVFHSARSVTEFDSAKLAAATVLASRAVPRAIGMSTDEVAQIVTRGAEIVLGDLDPVLRSPRPQHGERNAVIHAVPWEDVLIVSRLPLRWLPSRVPALRVMVSSLLERFIELPSGSSGWTLESDSLFPQPMSWITAAYSELLERTLRISRYAFTETFLRTAAAADPRRVERFADGVVDPNVPSWADVLETEEGSKRLIEGELLGSQQPTSSPKRRSLLLFGPPGTSKTTIVRGIAFQLRREFMRTKENERWPLLIVNPADIAGEVGYEGLIRYLRALFRQIRALSEVVVFFDEAENFVFGREEQGETRWDRLITASMLPLLNNIDAADIVFAMATNHIRAIDSAVRRRGRFGLRVGVGTPDMASRQHLVKRALLGSKTRAAILTQLVNDTNGLTIKEILNVLSEVSRVTPTADNLAQIVRVAKRKAEIPGDLRTMFTDDIARYHDGD